METEKRDSEKKIIKHEVKDELQARDIILDYLINEGIVVFDDEIKSVTARDRTWIVTIDGETFTGAIVIKSDTGEIISANRL